MLACRRSCAVVVAPVLAFLVWLIGCGASPTPADDATGLVDTGSLDVGTAADVGVDAPADCPGGWGIDSYSGMSCQRDCDCKDVYRPVCQENYCDPISHRCEVRTAPDGATCVPTDSCTWPATCQSGACVGPHVACDDNNPCTDEVCDPGTGACSHKPHNGVACDDSDPCTVNDHCSGGACIASPRCPDAKPCHTSTCDPVTATCVAAADGSACTDGKACTTDTCVGGSCVGQPYSCDDAKPCTNDSCDGVGGCVHAPASGGSCGPGKTCEAGVCDIQSSVPADMVYVPASGGKVGCIPGDGACADDEKPQHGVVTSALFVERNEVRFLQYQWCVDAGVCTAQGTGTGCTFGQQDAPVNCVTWQQANAYCAWKGRRLPTEAEWERAVRGTGASDLFPWGYQQPVGCDLAVYDACALSAPAAYASKPAGKSSLGLMDAAGNVAEWVADVYDATYYTTGKGSAIGPPPDQAAPHVIRGGSFASPATDLRVSHRDKSGAASPQIGFRCVIEPWLAP